MYHPNLGRWMTMDPIGFEGNNLNQYGYLSNSPINKLDPTGLADRTTIETDGQMGKFLERILGRIPTDDEIVCGNQGCVGLTAIGLGLNAVA